MVKDWVSFLEGAVTGGAWIALLLWYILVRPMGRLLGWDKKSPRRPGYILHESPENKRWFR